MTSCLALEETSFIGALGLSLGPHLKNSTEINHIFNCCLFMFKYLNTSQLLLVSNCLQCNVSRVAERGVKARSEVPLQGWTSNCFIDPEVISLYLSFHSFPNGQNHGLTFLGQSWRSNEFLQIFRSVAMLQRWVYHHYHHCHHSNTKHLTLPPPSSSWEPDSMEWLSILFHGSQAIQWRQKYSHGYVRVQCQLSQQALGFPKCLAILSREHIAQTITIR